MARNKEFVITTLDSIQRSPGPLTSAGSHEALLRTLPRELPALTRAIQGIQIHEYLLKLYDASVPEARKRESHLRRVDHMLAAVHARDPRPLDQARAPAERAIGVCRHFTQLLLAALRAHGVTARARVGFASYFNPPQYEDHWVGEYWNAEQKRWVLVDAQLDDVLCRALPIDFDPLDVPRDRFVIAHDAWRRARRGEIEAARFGFSPEKLTGLWFIAGDLVRDVAALNGVEMLPWDVWGAMPEANAELTPEQLAYFDRLARITRAPEECARELRELFEGDERLRPGAVVWNDRTQQREAVDAAPAGVALE